MLHALHSLQEKGHQKSIKWWIFKDPFHIKRPGEVILVSGLTETSISVSFIYEMRLLRSLRPLRLLRLLRSLRPLRFLMPGKSLNI
jgi:hypothetical protein